MCEQESTDEDDLSSHEDDEDCDDVGNRKRKLSISSTSSRGSSANGANLTAEEKLCITRERNRDHSRKSRLRKKMFLEGLRRQVADLTAYRLLVEQATDLISLHSADEKVRVHGMIFSCRSEMDL